MLVDWSGIGQSKLEVCFGHKHAVSIRIRSIEKLELILEPNEGRQICVRAKRTAQNHPKSHKSSCSSNLLVEHSVRSVPKLEPHIPEPHNNTLQSSTNVCCPHLGQQVLQPHGQHCVRLQMRMHSSWGFYGDSLKTHNHFLHLLALFRLKGPNERPGFKDACSDPGTETHIASWSRLTKVLGYTVKEPVLLHWESKPKKQSCKGLPLSQKFQLITGCPTKLGLQTPWVLLGGSRNLGDSSATLSLGKEVPWRCLSVLLLCHVSKPELRPSWCAPWWPKSKNWQNTYGANYALRGSQCTAKLHNHMLCPWTLWLLMSEKQLFECDIFFPKGTGSPCTKGDMGPGFSTRKGKHVHGQATSMQQIIRGNKIRAYK